MPKIIGMEDAPIHIGGHGEPKTGKTRLYTSLDWGPRWGERAIYVPWDPGSGALESVLPGNRERLVIVAPEKEKRKAGKQVLHNEAFSIASKLYKDPKTYLEMGIESVQEAETIAKDVGTIIWDTMTTTALDLLLEYADTGVFQGEKGDKHLAVGNDPSSNSYMAAPMEGDYGLAGGAIFRIIGFLFRQPLNVIIIFHSHDADDTGSLVGPGVVGKKAVKTVAGMVSNLFWSESKTVPIKGAQPPKSEERFVVHTQKLGRYMGGLRSYHGENPMPEVILQPDPVHFWRDLAKTLKGDK